MTRAGVTEVTLITWEDTAQNGVHVTSTFFITFFQWVFLEIENKYKQSYYTTKQAYPMILCVQTVLSLLFQFL